MRFPVAHLDIGQAWHVCVGLASASQLDPAHHITRFHAASSSPGWICRLGSVHACAAEQRSLPEWLDDVYDSLDYEAILFADDVPDDEMDDSAERFIYGESDLNFFEQILHTALDVSTSEQDCDEDALDGFCDLGGGKGQLALAAAHLEPVRLRGPCVSLELIPELHRIATGAVSLAASQDEAMSRVSAVRGNVYEAAVLASASIGQAACVYCYASKFDSSDGMHAELLSASLAASQLQSGAVVATVNRKLLASDGWREVAPSISGPTPQEDAGTGVAYFWARATD